MCVCARSFCTWNFNPLFYFIRFTLCVLCSVTASADSSASAFCFVVNSFCGTFVSLLGFLPPPLTPYLDIHMCALVCEYVCVTGSGFAIAFCLHYTQLTQCALPSHSSSTRPSSAHRHRINTYALSLAALSRSMRSLSLSHAVCLSWHCKWRFACALCLFLRLRRAHSPQWMDDRLWLPFCLPISFIFTFTQNGVWLNLTIVWFRLVWFFCSGSGTGSALLCSAQFCCSALLPRSIVVAWLLLLLVWLATLSPVLYVAVAIAVAGWFAFDFSC